MTTKQAPKAGIYSTLAEMILAADALNIREAAATQAAVSAEPATNAEQKEQTIEAK